MKTNFYFVLFISLGLILSNNLFAQTAQSWSEVIKEERGDTVVVMGYESCGYMNTLNGSKGRKPLIGSGRVFNKIPLRSLNNILTWPALEHENGIDNFLEIIRTHQPILGSKIPYK